MFTEWGTVIERHGPFQLKGLGNISLPKRHDLCHETLNSGHWRVQKSSFIDTWLCNDIGHYFRCILHLVWSSTVAILKYLTVFEQWKLHVNFALCPTNDLVLIEEEQSIPCMWPDSSYWATKLISTTNCKRGVVVRVLLVRNYFAKKGCARSWASGF